MVGHRLCIVCALWTVHSAKCFQTFLFPQRSLVFGPLCARRYGPAGDVPESNPFGPLRQPSSGIERQKQEFRELVEKVMMASDPNHVPSVLTKNMELILSLSGEDGVEVVESILDETREEQGEEAAQRIEEVIDAILSCTEDFVHQAEKIDNDNKKLLGQIIMILADKERSSRDREEALDELLSKEKDSFTPGFLRHIEGECERIANAPKMTPESARLLEILRTIQTRVLEELGNDLGESAQVLGQLIGYSDKAERLAVLEAGLTVRGLAFAQELVSLTEEALEGFKLVPGGADPGLIECVEQINERTRQFVYTEAGFQ